MQNYKGFTLLELMMTLTIAAILMSIALPATRNLQANMRVTTVANNLVSTLKSARSEALTSRRHVTVAAKSVSPPTTNNWGGDGWRVSELQNAVATTMFEQNALPASITIQSTPTVPSFRFEGSTGMAQNTDGSVLATGLITFRICDTGSQIERGRDVQINQFGRVFISTHANATTCNP